MKLLPASLALLGELLPLRGQEKALPEWDVEIPGSIADGARATPAPKPEPIDFDVLTSRTNRVQVTKAAEMPDLPPIKETINLTVQMVEDPGLPDPPPPLPALPPGDPAVQTRMEEAREKYRGTELIFVSATVYDHSRKVLRIYPNGNSHTVKIRERLAQHGHDFDEPEIPTLPDLALNGPSFVVTDSQKVGEAVDTLSQIHDL